LISQLLVTGSPFRAAYVEIAGAIIARGIRTTIDSGRLQSVGRDAVLGARDAGRPLVFVGWHGHDFVNIGVYHPLFGFDSRALVMVPDSVGAEILTAAMERLNVAVVRLAGAENSAQASRGLVSVIRQVASGMDALLAVDGPAGPARVAKPGAAFIAQRARAVIVPTAVASRPALRLRYRWDDHLVPMPGGRTMVHFGPLIDTAPAGQPAPSVEEITLHIERALTAGERNAAAALERD
jgi:lysophospholipid acyltransferase (LPLAT)-like uncharacterized protein